MYKEPYVMSLRRSAFHLTKALGITALVLGYGTYCLGKKVVKESKSAMIFSKEVYRQAKDSVNRS